ncbi:hypothetical protein ACFVQ3_02815 [Oerskovia sp. NPDC057915]|uniref:hypothetical protein n=1 Tax=Oerskovia sp. NPDC057915 TaxID=3346280 RepID=UPI0036DC3F0F
MQSKVGPVLVVIGSILGIALLVVGFLAVRTAIVDRPIDSYFLTYEVTSDTGVEAVVWTQAPAGDRTGASVEQSEPGPVGSPFTTEAVVAAGQPARVEATPAGEGTASCRVVKDVGRTNEAVLVEATSATPGAPVTCDVTMPTGQGFGK